MTVLKLLELLVYNARQPIVFKIAGQVYTYDDVRNSIQLLQVVINTIKIEVELSPLTDEHLIRVYKGLYDQTVLDLDILIPNNTQFYQVVITIN